MIELSGKVILVTGAARGIGACAARAVARGGADVVLHYRDNRARAEALAEELGAGRCRLVRADLAAEDGATALWEEALGWRGRLDVVVNNAGVHLSCGPESDRAAWRASWTETLQVNLIAVADLCREAIAHFRGRGGGIIINIASRAAFRGDAPDAMAYAGSKGGLVALTRTIARGYARQGVLAYVVAPGWARTDMAAPFLAAGGEAVIDREVPLGEMADPDDIGNIVAFLASGAARHATGATIDVNGASYMH